MTRGKIPGEDGVYTDLENAIILIHNRDDEMDLKNCRPINLSSDISDYSQKSSQVASPTP